MHNKFNKNPKYVGVKYLLIFLCLFCISCGQEKKTNSGINSATIFYLEKVDSIHIDRENKVRILDFDPLKNHFLAYDQITQEFLVLDGQGQVLEEIFQVGEGPNEYHSNLLTASFNREGGGYFALSSREFLWFNKDWEMENRIRFASHFQIRFYGGPRPNVPYYYLPGSSTPFFFTSFFPGTPLSAGGDEGEMASNFLIELYNPQKESLEWVLPYDPETLPEFTLNDNRQKKPVQVFALDRDANLMYLTFENSHEIGVYDLENEFQLKEISRFSHNNFNPSNKSKNTALFSFGRDTYGILYYMGLSEVATEAWKGDNPDYFPYLDPSLYKMIIIQKDGQQENEIGFPQGCEPHSEIIQLPGNRILLRDKYIGDNEPEYSTYSIFELKAE